MSYDVFPHINVPLGALTDISSHLSCQMPQTGEKVKSLQWQIKSAQNLIIKRVSQSSIQGGPVLPCAVCTPKLAAELIQ